MVRLAVKRVCTIAMLTLFCARPTFADTPNFVSKALDVYCDSGLKPAADAERAEDASDHDTAITNYQKSIIGYSDCLDKSGEGSKYAPDFHAERAHVRIMLTDLLYKADRTDDAQNQLFRILGDLIVACNNFDTLATYNKGTLSSVDAPIYAVYARKYGAPNPEFVHDNCHPAF